MCLLAQIKEVAYCPLHSSAQLDPDHLAHLVCVQDDHSTALCVFGWVASFSDTAKFWIFHVIRRNESARILEHDDFVALPQEISIHSPCSVCSSVRTPDTHASHFDQLFAKWPFQDTRHFLIRTGGGPKQFERWLLTRSRSGGNE